MQALVARYPELITDGDGDLLLVRREQSIADGPEGGGRWSLDHLFVTRDAVPVLVELKRAVDTRLRREVVGQMLDYAGRSGFTLVLADRLRHLLPAWGRSGRAATWNGTPCGFGNCGRCSRPLARAW